MDRADQSYGQPTGEDRQDAGAVCPGREGLRGRPERERGLGNSVRRHAAFPNRWETGSVSASNIGEVVLKISLTGGNRGNGDMKEIKKPLFSPPARERFRSFLLLSFCVGLKSYSHRGLLFPGSFG